jgi:Na+/melibiose symporter-like transporter
MSDVTATPLRMIGFSLPGMPLNALIVAVFVFLPPLYAEYQGLGPGTVGLIFLIAKISDVVAAPLWGFVMDTYKTPWGRRRPWLTLAVPVLTLAVYMIYNPPESAGTMYLFVWLTMIYMGWNMWTISHTSWALELSRDYDRRSRITGLLQVMVMLGGILLSLVPAVMERIAAPTYEEKASAIGWFMIFLMPIAVSICLMSVPERDVPPQPHLGFKKGAAILVKNAALLRLLITNALLTFSTYFVQGLFVFFVSYTLGLEDWVGFVLIFLTVGGLFGLPIWVSLSHNWSKHHAVQVAVLTGALAPLLLLALPPDSVVLTAAAFLIVGLNTSANEFLPRAMMADVCDHDRVNSGSERMGLYYSLLQTSSKIATGIGVFVGFSFLAVFGFDPELGLDNTPVALQRLRYLIVALPMLAYAIVIALMWRYPITRERQHEMRDILEHRESAQSGPAVGP